MDDISANVTKWALGAVRVNLLDFQGKLNAVQSDIDEYSDRCFERFFEQQRSLEEDLRKAYEKLRLAEAELAWRRQRVEVYYDEDGERHTRLPDCSRQEAQVEVCRRNFEACKWKVDRCRQLIADCQNEYRAHHHMLQTLQTDIVKAKDKLRIHEDDIADYGRISMRGYSDSVTATQTAHDNSGMLSDEVLSEKESANFSQLIGKIAPDSKIVVVDNTPFGGFGRLELFSDSSGKLHGRLRDAGDCTIYVNGKVVYVGPMSKY